MRAIVALRVSTDDQAEAGNGMNAQVDSCRAWAAREGRPVIGPFLDEGVSGAAPLDRRPGLMAALAEVGKGDVLLVAKRDRLGRDPFVIAMIEAAVKRAGGRVVSAAGEGTDGDGPTDVLMRRIVDAFGEYERLVIKARTKAALGAKARRGERVGQTPFGFDVVDDGRRSKSDGPLALVVNAAEAEALALIRELEAAGFGPRGIARELTTRGIPTKSGSATWSHTTILRILARPSSPTATHSAHPPSAPNSPHLASTPRSDHAPIDPSLATGPTPDPGHVLR